MRKYLAGLAFITVSAIAIPCALSGSQSPQQIVSTAEYWGKPGKTEPGHFYRPRCLAVAPDETFYVLDLTGRIQHFSADGKYLDQLQMPDITVGRPQGLDVDKKGFVYVADTHYNQIVKFAPTGEIVMKFGKLGKEGGKFFWPCAVAVTDDGTIFTAEYSGHDRIQKWTSSGRFIKAWGKLGTEKGEFARPAALRIGPDNLLYVADSCNHRIQVFDLDGNYVREFGSLGESPGQFRYPKDLAIDEKGNIITVEFEGNRVQALAPDGSPIGMWGVSGSKEGRIAQPWAMDRVPSGIIYITDTLNHRVVCLKDSMIGLRAAENNK